MEINLKNKIALVTGGSQGIGLACAKLLASLECRVIVLSRNEDTLKETVKSLKEISPLEHDYISVDLSNKESLTERLEQVLKYSPITIWVNSNGGPKGGLISNAHEDEFSNTFKQHLESSVTISKLLIPVMKAEGYGRIINILSTSVKEPISSLGVSTTIRWAVAAWAKTLSKEVAEYGITVNSILPGSTDTTRLQEVIENEAKQTGRSIEEIRNRRMEATPIKRFARPDEIANVVGFLASPLASYINGVALPVDGGQVAGI